ncbi:bifunctional precorrin-2 dehydrogenase/sirohydrochlorin ferrochelatase [Paenibacillus sp. YYML68]|uniref:precorrin-2 dehydrogenase/sirohydrochlorin ferrochelatase family protein n=1 Tax=Paenibacillus sp. YYML68 TaxID=2909250 RepID=UPI0024916871|nr:bifunctional precorrin-2 dehydrogenase/sirohydrochlorin ferrochelatase [Paenibacillus sp. YYML68]
MKGGKQMASTYPVMLIIHNEPCVVIGGGQVAARKVRGLLQAEAAVTVISPHVTSELEGLAADGSIRWLRSCYAPGMPEVREARLLFAATDAPEVNAAVRVEAEQLGIWVNAADEADHGSFLLPAVLRQGRLTVAVSTSGASPGMALHVRDQVSRWLQAEHYELYLELLYGLRQEVQQLVSDSSVRQEMFRHMLRWELAPHLGRGGSMDLEKLRVELSQRLYANPTIEGVLAIGEWLRLITPHDGQAGL